MIYIYYIIGLSNEARRTLEKYNVTGKVQKPFNFVYRLLLLSLILISWLFFAFNFNLLYRFFSLALIMKAMVVCWSSFWVYEAGPLGELWVASLLFNLSFCKIRCKDIYLVSTL